MEGVADFLPLPTLVMSGLSKKKKPALRFLPDSWPLDQEGGGGGWKRAAAAALSWHAKTGRRGFLRRKPNDVSKATPPPKTEKRGEARPVLLLLPPD